MREKTQSLAVGCISRGRLQGAKPTRGSGVAGRSPGWAATEGSGQRSVQGTLGALRSADWTVRCGPGGRGFRQEWGPVRGAAGRARRRGFSPWACGQSTEAQARPVRDSQGPSAFWGCAGSGHAGTSLTGWEVRRGYLMRPLSRLEWLLGDRSLGFGGCVHRAADGQSVGSFLLPRGTWTVGVTWEFGTQTACGGCVDLFGASYLTHPPVGELSWVGLGTQAGHMEGLLGCRLSVWATGSPGTALARRCRTDTGRGAGFLEPVVRREDPDPHMVLMCPGLPMPPPPALRPRGARPCCLIPAACRDAQPSQARCLPHMAQTPAGPQAHLPKWPQRSQSTAQATLGLGPRLTLTSAAPPQAPRGPCRAVSVATGAAARG